MSEEVKVYIYDVTVYDKNDEIIKTIPHQTMKDIEKLKQSFKNKEYVRYRLVTVETRKKK